MFDIFLDYVKKILKSRLFPITVIYLALFGIIINRLFVLQIVQGPEKAVEQELKQTSDREIKSTRGNIYDCNGKLLASNVLSYAVVMEDSTKIESNEQRNDIIYQLIKIIEKNGDTLDMNFFIRQNTQGDLEFSVDGTALTRFLKNVYAYLLEEKSNLSEDQKKKYLKSAYDYLINSKTELTKAEKEVLAKDTYDFLRDGTGNDYTHMFGISGQYSVEDTLKIMSVRYALFCNYPKYLQITVASNVTDKTMAAVKESSAELPGVEIVQQTQRVYEDALYFAHIIGYTGLISSDELEQMKAEGKDYNSTDYIGKSGIEKEYEEELSGTKGKEEVVTNPAGKVMDVVDHTDPIAGNDIYLTIDSDLQRNVYHLLEREITEILLANIVPEIDNYGSKGESATDIKIPVYEVYYALINNNIIDITSLNAPDATELEKQTYEKYLNARKEIFSNYDELLSPDSTALNSKAGDMTDFLDYFYQVLTDQNILQKSSIPEDDETFAAYKNGNISLSSLLQYAITNNWIDLAKLGVEQYLSTGEIYQKLIDYTENLLKTDDKFNKKIYRNLVFSYKLSGTEICLLLFDQGVLEYKAEDVKELQDNNSAKYAFDFIEDKISSLEITPAMLALEPCSGSVVITDVKSGDVLALVSYPSYDNNRFANKVEYDYFNQLRNDIAKPMINRPVASRIAPGSTFKMVTSFAALEEGVVTPSERIYDLGIFDKVTPAAKCHIYPNGTHGNVNIVDALKVSCNYFFYEMGWRLSLNGAGVYDEKLGLSKLQKYATLFGLNEPSGIELSNEIDPKMSDKDAIRSAIGQGTNAYTPAQLARYVTTLASHGKCYDLTVFDKISDKDGKVLNDNSAEVIHNITDVNSTTWDSVLQGMYSVVNDPNGGSVYSTFKDFPVTVAGKTGTSQISKLEPNNALFLSFAPYNNPEIAIATVIPNGYTSHNAAELTKNIYSLYFKLEDPKNLIEGAVKVKTANAGGAIE